MGLEGQVEQAVREGRGALPAIVIRRLGEQAAMGARAASAELAVEVRVELRLGF